MSRRIFTFNPNTDTPTPFSTTLGNEALGGSLYIWNESSAGIDFILPGEAGEIVAVPPWMGYPIKRFRRPAPTLLWTIPYTLSSSNPPIERCDVHVFDADEPLPSDVPIPLPRQTNVGNTVSTTNATVLQNDGNPPGTLFIEGTPNDQSASSWNEANDGSGFRKILSANLLRTVWNVVRGNSGVGKASIQFGDSADPTLATFYGSIQGSQPAALGNVTIALNDFIATSQDTTAQNRAFLTTSDAHSGKAWAFFQMQDGSILAQETSSGNFVFRIFPDGHAVILGAISTDNGQVASTGAGEFILNRVAPGTGATDTFILQRSGSFGTGEFVFGLDQNGRMYCFDSGRNGFLFGGASFETGSTAGGRLLESRSAGGGAAGAINWQGTTNPSAFMAEGDTWDGA